MKLIFLALKELSWLWNLGCHFPKLDYPQWLKVHIFAIWEIQTSRRIQHVGSIVKTIWYLRNKLSRDLGSPGSRQLLQLQLFSQILKFWTLLFILSCLGVCGFMNFVLFFPLLQFGLSWGQLFSCFSKNCCVYKCFGSWSLKFDLKMLSFWSDFFPLSLSEVSWGLSQKSCSLCRRCFEG